MAIDTFLAGASVGTYNAVALGVTKQGFEIEQATKAEMIDETDQFGLTTLDWIYRGQNCFVGFIARAWKAGPKAAVAPYGGGALGVVATPAVPIGVLASDLAKALVLTAVAATPAATDFATFTGSKAMLVPEFSVKWVSDSRLRDLPVRMQLLPYASGSNLIQFALT